jgi:hypothetical protein
MITFKEYMKEITLRALENKDFNINGNSPVAQYNKSFFERLGFVTKRSISDIKYIIKQPLLQLRLGEVLGILIVTILFPIIMPVSAVFIKVYATKELKADYIKNCIDKLHE